MRIWLCAINGKASWNYIEEKVVVRERELREATRKENQEKPKDTEKNIFIQTKEEKNK